MMQRPSRAPIAARVGAFPGVAAALLVALAAGCNRHPEKSAEGTLGLLRDALAARRPIDRLVDSRVNVESLILLRSRNIEEQMGIPLGHGALETQLSDFADRMNPQLRFAQALTYLRPGRCSRVAEAPLPDSIARAPQPGHRWPSAAVALQESVARRLTNAFAGDYRCGDGPVFRAVFVRPVPDDGSLRVVYVGSAAGAS